MGDYGQGVKQNYEEAVKWYRKAAERGDARAAQVFVIITVMA
ncbi:SEL1-like repeat protein [uncultured Megasphaera sp.]|nr:SEL1-like repeat protein [uncultured Megasphaera sp.]